MSILHRRARITQRNEALELSAEQLAEKSHDDLRQLAAVCGIECTHECCAEDIAAKIVALREPAPVEFTDEQKVGF